MRLRQLTFVLAAVAVAGGSPSPAAAAAPGRWRFDETVAGGGTRQARRIASPAGGAINVLSSSTTTPAPRTAKKLVTLAPGGNSIQDILFNNGYRDGRADAEPEPNNIDNDANLDGLDRRDVWLLDGNLLVLKGGAFSDEFSDTEPIDDFQAPYRQPKFPPPEFLGEEEFPPGLLTAWQYGFGGLSDPAAEFQTPPVGPEGSVDYSPHGRPESRPESVAEPHSNVGAPPYAWSRPYTSGRSHTDAQSYVDGKPYTSGESNTDTHPCVDGKPYTSERPHPDAQPYVDGKPYTRGQSHTDVVRPLVDSRPYAEVHPYTDGQPYDKGTGAEKALDDGDQPVNPELMKGYSPLGRPEPRPDTLYETPKMEVQPESQIKILPESQPESAQSQPFRPYNGQSYGERWEAVGDVGSDSGGVNRRRGGGVRFPSEAPSEALQLPSSAPGRTGTRTLTYSVRTSYSSTSSQSSTSVKGHNARYLPPPRDQRPPNPR